MNVLQKMVARSLWASIGAVAILAAGCATSMSLDGVASVTLSGNQEVPSVNTSASGRGTITVNKDKSVSGSVTTTGVNATAAHIHMGPAGQNGPVAINMTKTADGVWSVPAGADVTDAQYNAFNAGNLYINVHSAAYPAGEIRGQIKP